MTEDIILEVPGDNEKDMALALAAWLTQPLDLPTVEVTAPTRMAELRVTEYDISVGKEELRDNPTRVGVYGALEVRVENIRISRDDLESAWLRCPTALARKLIRAGRVVAGWYMVRVEAILKRPLQCYRCLDLGHVRGTGAEAPVTRPRSSYCP